MNHGVVNVLILWKENIYFSYKICFLYFFKYFYPILQVNTFLQDTCIIHITKTPCGHQLSITNHNGSLGKNCIQTKIRNTFFFKYKIFNLYLVK